MSDPNQTDLKADSFSDHSQDIESEGDKDKEIEGDKDKEIEPVKDKKPKSVKDKKPNESNNKKIKTAVHLSEDASKKLGAACVYEKKSQSELIEFLITKELSTYSVSAREQDRRIKLPASSDRPKPAAGASPPA
jgi:hypothetical protein